jgi:hypothetical protein
MLTARVFCSGRPLLYNPALAAPPPLRGPTPTRGWLDLALLTGAAAGCLNCRSFDASGAGKSLLSSDTERNGKHLTPSDGEHRFIEEWSACVCAVSFSTLRPSAGQSTTIPITIH